jgi:NAD(P)-dependent dehydrogenase (short-subunit alcohol dehydrogenase family)
MLHEVPMDLELKGKKALITGASRGIGRAVAEALLREKCEDIVIVSSQQAPLEEARREMLAMAPGARVTAAAGDLKDHATIHALVSRFPNIDILVNNAGAIPHGTINSVSDEAWLEAWDLKVHGFIRFIRAYYPLMAKRRSGVIVNIIGYAGDRVTASYIAGSTGNAALIALTKALGASSPADNVRVVGVNPGHVLTERLKKRLITQAKERFSDGNRWPELATIYPFGRAGMPAELGDAVAFLASPRAGYISGTIVTVDGGMTNRPVF